MNGYESMGFDVRTLTQDRKQASRDKDSVLRVIPTSMKSALRNTFLNFGKLPKGETQHIGLNKATLSLYQ